MWKGVTWSLGPCSGGRIAGMAVGSQCCSLAARVYRAEVMMCWASLSRTMWRSVPKSFGRLAVGWTVMWARSALVGFFYPVRRLRPFVPWDVLVPIMTDLTASDGTLFEPHLNGLNHRKNSNGAVEFI